MMSEKGPLMTTDAMLMVMRLMTAYVLLLMV
jgi:hypothetical protein